MPSRDDLQLLFDFHYWARDRMLDAVEPLTPEQFTRDLGSSFRSVRDTLAHIYAAEWVWHARWLGESPTELLPASMFPDLASLRQTWQSHEARVRAYLDALDAAGLHRVIEYRLLNGTPGALPFWQMAQHVVNHASYHRGQVVTMLRQLGAAPPQSTDMVAFYRTRQV
jgi:uncharacterized damage-inducible protein DinB